MLCVKGFRSGERVENLPRVVAGPLITRTTSNISAVGACLQSKRTTPEPRWGILVAPHTQIRGFQQAGIFADDRTACNDVVRAT